MKIQSTRTSEASSHPYKPESSKQDTPLRVGILGCGYIVQKAVASAVLQAKGARLEAIASRVLSRAQRVAKQFQTRSIEGYAHLIEDPSVDVVYIALPNAQHLEWILKALYAGKHVICEKPAVVNLKEAEEVIQVGQRKQVRFMEAYMFWFHPQHREVERLIREGVLGDVFHFEGFFGFPPLEHDNFRYSRSLGGGARNDLAGYPISAVRRFFREEPIAATATSYQPPGYEVDLRGTAQLEFASGKTAQIAYGFDNSYRNSYTLWGTKGILTLGRAFTIPADVSPSMTLTNSEGIQSISTTAANHFVTMIEEFCRAIQEPRETQQNFEEEFLAQARVMSALASSVQKGQRVRI